MNLKDPERMRNEWWQLHPKLQEIITWANVWGIEHGEEPTWTSWIRTDTEQLALFEAGLTTEKVDEHMFGRGGDKRLFKKPGLDEQFVIDCNEKFPYDPTRPQMKTASIHGGTAQHVHLKVVDNLGGIEHA